MIITFNIGIIGSDNSHALAFAKLCNIPDENGNYVYDDVRVTAIYGYDDDPGHTKQVAADGRIEFIADSLDEFFGRVDAVMIVYRHGRKHLPHALPFIEKGYPVWIDKPLTESTEDVRTLRAALKSDTLITGGSTLKYCPAVVELAARVRRGELGEIKGGSINFSGDFESEYGGIFFYGPHICEICAEVFGYDVKSVLVSATNAKNATVLAKYDDKQVALNIIYGVGKYFITVHGTKDSAMAQIDMSNIYRAGFAPFVSMLRDKKMPLDFERLVMHVYMLEAMQKSYETGKEISLDGLM